jgi:outer membrane protein
MVRQQFIARYRASIKWVALVALVTLCALAVAPKRDSQIGIPTLKIGYVDMTKLFNEYQETKIRTAVFEKEWNDAQEEINQKARRLEELKNRLQEQGNTLGESEKQQLESQIDEAERDVKDYYELSLKRLRRREDEIKKELLDKLQKEIDDYGTREGYSMIFRESTLLHAAPTYDLTDEILRRVNTESETGTSG